MRFADPVIGREFVGREKILEHLRKRASALPHGYRHNIALLGAPLIGKSSLLLQFLESFHAPRTLTFYLEIRSGESFDTFLHRFLNSFLYQFLKQVQGAASQESLLLTQQARALIPKTVQEIEALRASRLTSTERFKKLLELPHLFYREFRSCLVFVLDEFDKLLELEVGEPFLHLGKQIMVQRQTMYLVASSQIPLAERILKQKLALLFGQFETIFVEPFDVESSRKLLETKWNLQGLPSEFKEYLLLLTGGRPFYLNVLGEELQKSTKPLSTEDFFDCLKRQLLNAQGILAQYFGSLAEHLSRQDRSGTLLTLLQRIAEGRYTASALRSVLQQKGQKRGLPLRLERLVSSEFLGENGSFYFLRDPLFAFWLSTCSPRKSDAFSRIPEEISRSFHQEMKKRFQYFLVSRKQEPLEKIQRLFESFQGEMVEVDRKKQRIPSFKKVQRMPWEGKGGYLEAQGEGGVWVSAVHSQLLHEEEIFAFLEHCKGHPGKIQKKILIPLRGMDDTARLLAKEARLWTWELSQLNLLFRVHGQGLILERSL